MPSMFEDSTELIEFVEDTDLTSVQLFSCHRGP